MNKLLLLLLSVLLLGTVYAAYLGGRELIPTDMFYITTPYWGKIQCIDFEHLNGTMTYCFNGFGASMTRKEITNETK
jgi:hypothetical protein